MKNDLLEIDISLHPLCWKVLKRDYGWDGKAVNLQGSYLYSMVRLALEKERVTMAAYVKRTPKEMVPGKVYITETDFFRNGCYIRIEKQAVISRLIFNQERDRLCELVRTAKTYVGVGTDTAMKYYIDKYDYDYDITFDSLKKYYQRHYAGSEDGYLNDLVEFDKILKEQRKMNILRAKCPVNEKK